MPDNCLLPASSLRSRPVLRSACSAVVATATKAGSCATEGGSHFGGVGVTCLCPTYGRFARLREALACFLAQDYPNKRLIILNDAPVPIRVAPEVGSRRSEVGSPPISGFRPPPSGVLSPSDPSPPPSDLCPSPSVAVRNAPHGCFANLGEKRQALLELAETPLVAHWDDDDLYLPWHLSRAVAALLARPVGPDGLRSPEGEVGCVKARGAWYLTGPREALQFRGIRHNVFEGSMVFRRQEALDLGGYPPVHSGQAKALLDAFHKAGRLHGIGDREAPTHCSLPTAHYPFPSYVYRWGQGVAHISSIGNGGDAGERFRQANHDFGDGEPLTPGDLTPYWSVIPSATSAKSADRTAVSEEAPA